MKTQHPDQVLGTEEAAGLAGLSVRTLQRLCRAGAGPKRIRLSPGRVGFRLSDVLAWLETRAAQAD